MQKLLLAAMIVALSAGTTPAADSWKPGDPMQVAGGKLVFDVQERLRLEIRDNNFDFNAAANAVTDDTFLLQRFRLGVLAKPGDWVRLYAQGQDVRQLAAWRPDVPFAFGSEGDDTFDLRQAYIEIGNAKEFPLSAKVGRQELSYGDERLIGGFDWNNFARTFDAIKLRYSPDGKKFWIEALAAHVVTIDSAHFNDANWNDTLVGLYASTTVVSFQTTDFYFFYRNKEANGPSYRGISGTTTNIAFAYDVAQEIWTPGLRIKSLPGKVRGFDYELEAAYQFGRAAGQQGAVVPTSTTTLLDHSAFAIHAGGGYTFTNLPGKPRLGLEYNVASGDTNPNDTQDGSFLNLFPTNHKFYGYMDVFAWKNVHNPAISLKCTPYQDPKQPFRALTVQLDGHGFWLYTNKDAWYRANAVTRVRTLNAAAESAGTYVGSELDLTVAYTPVKWLKLQAGYSHFFTGDYARATGASSDADFGYLQTTLQF